MEFKFCFLVLFLISTVTEGSKKFGSLESYLRNKIHQKRSSHQDECQMLRDTRHDLIQLIVALEEAELAGGLANNSDVVSILNQLYQSAATMINEQTTENESTSTTQSTDGTTTATSTSDTTEHSTSETTATSTSDMTETTTSETTATSTSDTTETTTAETTASSTSDTTEHSTSETTVTTTETSTTQANKRLIQLEKELVRELFLKKLKESVRNK